MKTKKQKAKKQKAKYIRYNKAKLEIAGRWTNPHTGEVFYVVDALVPIGITVKKEDWSKGVRNNITKCAVARGGARSLGIDPDDDAAVNASGLTVYRYAVHLPQPDYKLGKVLMRYAPPNYAKLWDEGKDFDGDLYVVLRPPPYYKKLIAKREDSRKRGEKRRGARPKRKYPPRGTFNQRRQNIGWKTDAKTTTG